jgi:hypothetical protein
MKTGLFIHCSDYGLCLNSAIINATLFYQVSEKQSKNHQRENMKISQRREEFHMGGDLI